MATRRGKVPSTALDITPLVRTLHLRPELRMILPVGGSIDEALRWNA